MTIAVTVTAIVAAEATAEAVTVPGTASGGTATHDADTEARGRRCRGEPYGAAWRVAGRHRVPAHGPLGRVRHLGRRRLPRRGPRARGSHALPRAPAVQGHQPPDGAGDLRGHGRGRRRAERVHRQGVHLLLRPGS